MAELLYPFLTADRLRMLTDGEGVTTLVAGAGCPLSCRYCINRKLLLKQSRPLTARELYEQVKIDSLYFLATGGGITFGGGEALLHARFIREFRDVCDPGWKLYAETCLWVPEENVRIAADCIDGFIVDIKTCDPEIYAAYTGKPLNPALNNLKLLRSLVPADRITVRVPLIPDFNTEEDCSRTEACLRKLGISRIDRFTYVIRENMN